jgi:hypothetical protein
MQEVIATYRRSLRHTGGHYDIQEAITAYRKSLRHAEGQYDMQMVNTTCRRSLRHAGVQYDMQEVITACRRPKKHSGDHYDLHQVINKCRRSLRNDGPWRNFAATPEASYCNWLRSVLYCMRMQHRLYGLISRASCIDISRPRLRHFHLCIGCMCSPMKNWWSRHLIM